MPTGPPQSVASVSVPETPWSETPENVLAKLQSDPGAGLTTAEARRRKRIFGPNSIRAAKPQSVWRILAHQFASLIVALLASAAALAMVFGDWFEGVAVLAVLAINAAIGFFTEWRAIRSMEALRELVRISARIRRDGELQLLPAHSLVPGDIVQVEAGDVIPADIRIVEASQLNSDESSLTGESVPVSKTATALTGRQTPLAERTSMLYRGASITRGNAVGVVTATGMASELGKISEMISEAEHESTPLEKRLNQLGNRLVWLTLATALITAILGIIRGKDPYEMVETAIALAVAAIPEGLPVVATIALARGLWRMAEQNALINRLSAVETLGATGVICTDKTGTLTENRMTAVRAISEDGESIDLTEEPIDPEALIKLRDLLRGAVLCNDAEWHGSSGESVGDPMEIALLAAAVKCGYDLEDESTRAPRIREIPFESETRRMATIHEFGDADGRLQVFVKGAPEAVFEICELTSEDHGRWTRTNEDLAGEGLRVLAFACKLTTNAEEPDERIFSGLQLSGLLGLIDPSRSDVPDAIEDCRDAGIRVVMITGDQAPTGAAIAEQIGLVADSAEAQVVHGNSFDSLSRHQLLEGSIFARATPAQKLELVRHHQDAGAVVAMTGDGVNDAPALQQADIGIAMGLRGTDVAREASDMVLKDDAFPSIVVAVRQGRTIFANIRKFVIYLLSCNLSEILVVGLAVVIASALPILPLQILFLNLVTDVFPALALGVGHAGTNLMTEKPRPTGERILRSRDWHRILIGASVIAVATLGAFGYAAIGLGLGFENAVTVSFLTLAFAQLIQVFNMADEGSPFFTSEVVANRWVWAAVGLCVLLLFVAISIPGLASILGLHFPSPAEWTTIAAFSFVPMAGEWIRRWFRRIRDAKSGRRP